MLKKSYKLRHLYDPNIKVGDEVFLIDGSTLTLLSEDNEDKTNNYYIVYAYPAITGSELKLQAIKAKVITINIKDRIYISYSTSYVQDIVVQIGNAQFRTCSGLIRKIK